jgi:hypothetical protein
MERWVTWCMPSYWYVTVPFSGLVEEVRSEPVQTKVRVWVIPARGMDTPMSWLAPS